MRPATLHTTSLAMVVGVSNVLYHPISPLRKQHFYMHAKVTECPRASRRNVSSVCQLMCRFMCQCLAVRI